MTEESRSTAFDEQIRVILSTGDGRRAATLVLRELGPEVFGFLCGSLGRGADADEVFAAASERMWRSLSTFRWQCGLRTWFYVIARNEIARFLDGKRRRNAGRVTTSELEDVVAKIRTETRSALRSEKRNKLHALRDELSVPDRTLLILRVDRDLPWEEIARAFLPDPDDCTPEQIKREAARLRKRFQLVKERLGERARQEGLIP
jgi:RNA polymerase sigma-70 factor, ECF subfamily